MTLGELGPGYVSAITPTNMGLSESNGNTVFPILRNAWPTLGGEVQYRGNSNGPHKKMVNNIDFQEPYLKTYTKYIRYLQT